MAMVSEAVFSNCLDALAENNWRYGGRVTISPRQRAMYRRMLAERFDDAGFQRTVRRILETKHDRFPTVADFFEEDQATAATALELEAGRQFELACRAPTARYDIGAGKKRWEGPRERCSRLGFAAYEAVGGREAVEVEDKRAQNFLRAEYVRKYVALATGGQKLLEGKP